MPIIKKARAWAGIGWSSRNGTASVGDRVVDSLTTNDLRKYCRWSHMTGYAMQLCLEGIQARAKYQSTYVTAG
jgi:hypothetical protein